MKKFLTGLVVLAMAGGLFAQELKFDGYVNSGLGLIITDQKVTDPKDAKKSKSIDPFLTAFGVDSWQYGYRFRLNGSYTNEADNAGARFRFQSQATTANFFSIPFAYVWTKFLDGVITVNGGLVDDGTWNSSGFILADDQGEGLGALVKISPITGLDIGAGAYVLTPKGGDDNNVLSRDLAKNRLDLDDVKYTLNLGYTLPELLKFTATYRTKNTTNGANQSSRAIINVSVLAISGLTAVVEAELDNLQDFEALKDNDKNAWGNAVTSATGSSGKANFYETLGYKAGDLGVGLNAAQYFSLAVGANAELLFNPWVSYTIGSIVPRLDIAYLAGGRSNFVQNLSTDDSSIGKYHRQGFFTTNTYDSDHSLLSFRPSVKINLTPKIFIELGDLINIENGPGGSYGHPEDLKASSRFTNVFYTDFKVSF